VPQFECAIDSEGRHAGAGAGAGEQESGIHSRPLLLL